MSLEDISTRFIDLGLSDDEARVLTRLYVMGGSKASAVAKAIGIPRIAAYRVLKRLQEKNLVESSLSRPVVYLPLPADKVVDVLLRHASDCLSKMQMVKDQVLQELSKFKTPEPIVEAKYKIVQERTQIYSIISQMINSARSDILFYADKENLVRMYYAGVSDKLVEAQRRGIKIIGLMEIEQTTIEFVENYTKYADVRHVKIPGISIFLVIDNSELLQSATTKETEGFGGEANVALWTNAKNFVGGIKGLLKESWDNAIDAKTKINALKGGAQTLQDIIIVKGWKNVSEIFANMLSNAKKEVYYIAVPYDQKFFDPALTRFTTSLREKDVKINVLTTVERDSLERIKFLKDFVNVKHTDLAIGMNILIIDNVETLLLPPAIEMGTPSAIWSNLRDYMEYYKNIFNNLWDSALGVSRRIEEIDEHLQVEELVTDAKRSLKDLGCVIKKSIKGKSGLSHDFSIVASQPETEEIIVIDVAGAKKMEMFKFSLVNFVSKCIDIDAKNKLLVTMLKPDDIWKIAEAYTHLIHIVNKDDMKKFFVTLKK